MPLPLACCRDGEALAAARDGGTAQLAVGVLRATRIPGLHYMCTRPQSRLRRLLWSLAFLASAGLLATGTADRLHHLLSHPVHTRARLAWAPQLRFPAITLCNPNRARFLRLTKPDLYSVGQWLGLAQENRSLVPEMLAVLGEDQRAWLTRLANYSRFLPPRRSERTMQSFFHRLGHQIEDMLVECRFQGERCGPQHFAPVSPLLAGAGQQGCPMGAGRDASPSRPSKSRGLAAEGGCRGLDEPFQGPCKVSPFQHLHGIGKGSPWISSCL
ncbi:acid-sensing ion channel 1C-like [Pluvialis apricaria]